MSTSKGFDFRPRSYFILDAEKAVLPEADVEQWLAENSVMQEMDRLCQLLGRPSAGYDGQTAFAKQEDVT